MRGKFILKFQIDHIKKLKSAFKKWSSTLKNHNPHLKNLQKNTLIIKDLQNQISSLHTHNTHLKSQNLDLKQAVAEAKGFQTLQLSLQKQINLFQNQ